MLKPYRNTASTNKRLESTQFVGFLDSNCGSPTEKHCSMERYETCSFPFQTERLDNWVQFLAQVEIFSTPLSPDPPGLLFNAYSVFSAEKIRPAREADQSSPTSVKVNKGRNFTFTPPTRLHSKVLKQWEVLYFFDLHLLLKFTTKIFPVGLQRTSNICIFLKLFSGLLDQRW